MSNQQTFIVPSNASGMRLDVFLTSQLAEVTRSRVQRMITSNEVRVNGETKSKHYLVKTDDVVSTDVRTDKQSELHALSLPNFTVIASCDDYIIIDKPAGCVVHPDSAHPAGTTLIDAIVSQFPEIKHTGDEQYRPGVVHRLDKDVSGVMIVARNEPMFTHLKNLFRDGSVSKEYRAIAHGIVQHDEFDIEFPIARKKNGYMAARTHDQGGKHALTHVRVVDRFRSYSSLAVFPKTGRTHQIRVHLFAHGHPIVGEPVYISPKLKNKSSDQINRICLHAYRVSFIDLRNQLREYTVELPKSYIEIENLLRNKKPIST